ncbi:hypothetical protein CcrBL47_gp432 [Caulobacter phage BL47]|nr:hypothetical protein CcrBL47_gp432 [Caulobacter phage BL47]
MSLLVTGLGILIGGGICAWCEWRTLREERQDAIKPLAQMTQEEKETRMVMILNRLGAIRKEEGLLTDELFMLKESMS